MIRPLGRTFLTGLMLVVQLVTAQVPIPPGFGNRPDAGPPVQPPKEQPPQPPKPDAAKPDPAKPAAAKPTPEASPEPPAAQVAQAGGLNIQNASLTQVIDILARQLKLNYILDPRVKGGVTINTYGETKNLDNRALLDTILRINGAAMVQQGDIWRIVPLTDIQKMPGLRPELDGKPVPNDDSAMLNLMFLKYATVDDLAKVLNEFLGEYGKMWSYPPANLLLVQDTRRNMARLMELISLFDSNTFANQRVRLFEVKNSRPTDIAKELEGILKGISLNDKSTPIKLLPVDRINTLIAVAPNPGVFGEVEAWLKKLDIAVTSSAGSVDNFVYRVRYGYAPTLALALMGLYSNNPMMATMMMMSLGGGMGMGMGPMSPNMGYGGMGIPGGGMYGGGMGGGMYGGGMYGGGMGGGMYGGGMYGGGMGMAGMYGGMMGGMYPGMAYGGGMGYTPPMAGLTTAATSTLTGPQQAGADLTGSYLGSQTGAQGQQQRIPRIIPNPFDNTLLIQSTRNEYDGILKILRDIDVPPRQVLIEAKIYEVNLTGALSSGVSAFLQARTTARRQTTGSLADGVFGMTTGILVGQSRELLAALSLQEVATNARVISAPQIIATDSIPAALNVGQQVPTLTSSAATGIQQGGNSLFANNVSNRDTGVTLNVMARVNPSGIVTLMINQEVSAPIPPDPTATIQSPSFSKRTLSTQVTMQDGDTIAIGGIINEGGGSSSTGIPVLHKLPVVGAAFGSRSYRKDRTELIVFMTPRVIYDMNHLNEASDELRSRLRDLRRYMRPEDR